MNDAMQSALEPVAGALRDHARERAAALLAAADADVQEITGKAQSAAAAVLAHARSDGRSAAGRTARIALATARRTAHGTILAAQRRAYDAVRSGMSAKLPASADGVIDRELTHDGERIEALWA